MRFFPDWKSAINGENRWIEIIERKNHNRSTVNKLDSGIKITNNSQIGCSYTVVEQKLLNISET